MIMLYFALPIAILLYMFTITRHITRHIRGYEGLV